MSDRITIVIPVYNEEAVLPTLFARLYPALDALGMAYEIVFVNDGSKDRSVALLREQFSQRPQHTRVVLFHANFGQHSAVMAGLAYARGEAGILRLPDVVVLCPWSNFHANPLRTVKVHFLSSLRPHFAFSEAFFIKPAPRSLAIRVPFKKTF